MNSSVYKYTIEEIFFILTTNTKRIRTTIHYLKFWANFPNINCLLVFEEMDFMNCTNITDYLIHEGILCEIQTSNVKRYEERYYQLFNQAWNKLEKDNHDSNIKKKIQWFAVGDDDTLWFINNLLRLLEYYNSSSALYLGNTSTKKILLNRHGAFFGYGGAGILFSRPLVLLFVQHRQECEQFLTAFGGDEMIGKCVTQVLKINLTKNNHFHQMDLFGDMLGLIENGMDRLVTLHHMFSHWRPFPDSDTDKLNETIYRLSIAYTTFNEHYLKRYLYFNYNTNQSVLLTLGHSVSVFNRILSHKDFSQIEKTWCCDEIVDRITRPKEENKTTWYFQQMIKTTSTDIIKYEMIYENKTNYNNPYSNIKVTIKNVAID
ncbi:hypothetical protein I4U23_003733 [Adineta vaga]|nr:hypothetical protein I4U23_003733 [Adineta vaga]